MSVDLGVMDLLEVSRPWCLESPGGQHTLVSWIPSRSTDTVNTIATFYVSLLTLGIMDVETN